ncbi:unnamed protein product [Paramecium sonneborni]|uniref:Uncharacterized protein n=1 Tax=Paramecium sonneborni TaxID=65129 RepID=A0A8S1K015_9CILI|nr:unnamed protein product [Paramecium sonneborni]
MQNENTLIHYLNLKSPRNIRSNSNKITNITQQQRIEISKRFQLMVSKNSIKPQNINPLYPNLTERVENQVQRNLLSTRTTQRDAHSQVKASHLISRFRLRISKSIEKYINKQENQTLIKILSYKEMDAQVLTPRQLTLEARIKNRNENYSVFYRKIKRVQSDHQDQQTTNIINNNKTVHKPLSYYFSSHACKIK